MHVSEKMMSTLMGALRVSLERAARWLEEQAGTEDATGALRLVI